MGIARFYRWLSERYPLINEVIEVDNVPEFDNFYLDMNGIIHHCSHGNTGGRKQASEDHMWLDVFKYISGLVYRIKPKKLLYLAVDGVAPRAKMNQQRSRRFRAAHDAKESRDRSSQMTLSNGASGDSAVGFDSNCITPGTEFMERLVYHLEFFVQKKIAEDPLWRDLEVVLSGPDVPGEGEHKIMDYIRSAKSQPDFNPNTRHCLYGLDADLIMLSLASHEPYFALLREEIDFSFSRTKSKENRSMVKPDKFQLLHIGVLREYLALDFLGESLHEKGAAFDRVIDDFVMFCFLVGNDFLPHLPFSEIGEGGLNKLFGCYKELMRKNGDSGHFLAKENGQIDYANLYVFLEEYMVTEYEMVDELLTKENWKIGQTRICNSAQAGPTAPVLPPKGELYAGTDSESAEVDWATVPVVQKAASRRVTRGTPISVEAAMDEYYDIKLGFVDDAEAKQKLVMAYLEGLQWVYYYYYKGPPSWDWYYPYHYSPFAVDVVDVLERQYAKGATLSLSFEQGKPFKPFQQLMAVLPAASGKNFLPQSLYNLMVSPRSPIRDFYPEEFQIDIDGVKVPWGGVTIITFVDEKKLVAVIDQTIRELGLSASEAHRNSLGVAKLFSRASATDTSSAVIVSVVSTIPSLVKSVEACRISVKPFEHKPLPSGMEIFPHHVLPGYSRHTHKDFPSLFKFEPVFEVSFAMGSGVRVFNSASRQESLIVTLQVKASRFDELESLFSVGVGLNEKIAFNFPFYSKQFTLVAATDGSKKVRFVKGRPVAELCERNKHEGDIDFLMSRMEETGLLIDLEPVDGNDSAKQFYAQPVLEVSADVRRPETIKALACIAMIVKRDIVVRESAAGAAKQTEAEEPLSLDVNNEVIFGRSFTVVGDAAVFSAVPTAESAACVKAGISELIKISKSVKYSQWLPAFAVGQSLGVSEDFVWSVFGEVWIRFGKFQEEVGMNLWSSASTGEPQCVPGYSRFTPSKSRRTDKRGNLYWNRWDQPDRREWTFSQDAVSALRDYMRDLPELTQELSESVANATKQMINGGVTLQGKRLFGRFKRPEGVRIATSRDDWVSEYHLNKLVSYVNSAKWKNLNICPWNYEALSSSFIAMIAKFTEQITASLLTGDVQVPASQSVALTTSSLNSSLKNGPEIELGQRGITIKANGLVPVGTWGTVVGFYGSDLVDILLDNESMNASSLNGVCPEMRGIRIKRDDWRAPKSATENPKNADLNSAKNKILAALIIEHEKSVASTTGIRPVVSGAVQPMRRGNQPIQSAGKPGPIRSAGPAGPIQPVPPGGIKLSVQDLFGQAKAAAAPSESQPPTRSQKRAPMVPSTMPRRPLAPTALMSLPADLVGDVPPQAPPKQRTNEPEQIPEFLLSKLRQPKQ